MENEELCEIRFTAGSIEEARVIARYLVQERLVACAKIIPWIESVYRWNGELDTSQESAVLLKTRRVHFEKVAAIIKKNSKYEVPEIVAFPIIDSNADYREWVLEETVNTY